jgi:hypothetical protein
MNEARTDPAAPSSPPDARTTHARGLWKVLVLGALGGVHRDERDPSGGPSGESWNVRCCAIKGCRFAIHRKEQIIGILKESGAGASTAV